MKRVFLTFAMIAMSTIAFAQSEGPTTNGSCSKLTESNFHLGLDLQTKYLWRGMEMMTEDAAPVVFPAINYSNKGFYAYVMGGYAIIAAFPVVILSILCTVSFFKDASKYLNEQ